MGAGNEDFTGDVDEGEFAEGHLEVFVSELVGDEVGVQDELGHSDVFGFWGAVDANEGSIGDGGLQVGGRAAFGTVEFLPPGQRLAALGAGEAEIGDGEFGAGVGWGGEIRPIVQFVVGVSVEQLLGMFEGEGCAFVTIELTNDSHCGVGGKTGLVGEPSDKLGGDDEARRVDHLLQVPAAGGGGGLQHVGKQVRKIKRLAAFGTDAEGEAGEVVLALGTMQVDVGDGAGDGFGCLGHGSIIEGLS